MRFFSIIILVILFSCHKDENNNPTDETGLFIRQINYDAVDRRYAIYIPNGVQNQEVPLIFELHGGGVYIEDMTGQSGYKTPYKLWMQVADTAKFIVVYPEGLNGAYGKPTWQDCRADCFVSSFADDTGFIEKLIDVISDKYSINQRRIYVSGTSNGGLMALRLAVEKADKFAAVASVAAAMPAQSSCGMPVNPLPVLFMNGTDDNHLPYNGGTVSNPPNPNFGTVMSVENSVDLWVNLNQCQTSPEHYTFPDLDTNDGGVVEKFTYNNSNGNQVVLYRVNGGGHSAPSIRERYSALFEQSFNKQNHDIETVFEVWKFFKDKNL
jgi:polyhydroxybutyrate depolymerase